MRTLLTFLSLALAAPAARAQAPAPDPLLARMIGRWVLTGTIAGRPTTHDVTFAWLLGHEYVQMHEVSREKDSTGAPAYEASVLITRDPATGEYAAQWLDNTGISAFDPRGVGRGPAAGDSIAFRFHYTDSSTFHTTFLYDRQHDAWEWHMDDDAGGKDRVFARVRLRRR